MEISAIDQAIVFEAIHIGGSLPKPISLTGTDHLRDLYADWSTECVRWAVLVPNRFFSKASFHTGYTPSWTQGNIMGKGRKIESRKKFIICDLGSCDMERHMEEKDCCIVVGPRIRDIGSKGGHGYGWKK